jgi:ferrous iron transport protein A
MENMPLVMAPCNTEMEIKKVSAEDKTRKHLNEMGIVEGSKITLLSSTSRGVIVIVKEGRLCLDGALARKILVA